MSIPAIVKCQWWSVADSRVFLDLSGSASWPTSIYYILIPHQTDVWFPKCSCTPHCKHALYVHVCLGSKGEEGGRALTMLLFECPKLPGGLGLLRVLKFQISLPHNPVTLHLLWLWAVQERGRHILVAQRKALSFQCHSQHLPVPGKGRDGNISAPEYVEYVCYSQRAWCQLSKARFALLP